jgi:thiol-disulfide isomerase/thioredoxin
MRRLWAAAIIACALGTSFAVAAASLPRRAPNCSLRLPAGAASIDQLRGKVVYVDFWASWCVSCLASFPFMERMQRELGPKGLQVVAVNLDQRPADANRFLAAHHVSFPIALGGNDECAKKFGVGAMPSSFIVDRRGQIRLAHSGFSPGEGQGLRSFVERLLTDPAQP